MSEGSTSSDLTAPSDSASKSDSAPDSASDSLAVNRGSDPPPERDLLVSIAEAAPSSGPTLASAPLAPVPPASAPPVVSPTLAPSPASVAPAAPPAVAWRSWPVRSGLNQAWTVVIPVGLAATCAGLGAGEARWGVVAGALVALAMWRFFVPIDYDLDARGVSERIWGRSRRLPWNRFDFYLAGSRGVTLVRRGRWLPSRVGLYLPFENRRREILANLAYHLGGKSSDDRERDFQVMSLA